MADSIPVQVCYAKPGRIWLRDLSLAPYTTLEQAIHQSGILQDVPEIYLTEGRVGIFGKPKSLNTPLHAHDRIEIYRPLTADPQESRRRRATKSASA